jgi:uncharacterized protein
MNPSSPETRVAILTRMVKNAPGRPLGRTQVMKLFYFLQELKGVRLGYRFRLFNYGPFDSEVLSDISSACGRGTVVEDTVLYPGGYGYAIKPGPQADRFDTQLISDAPELALAVDYVVREFGGFSAAELELRSTIFFVEREFAADGRNASSEDIVERVRLIKPHFDSALIRKRVTEMTERGHLQTASAPASRDS